MSLPHRTAAGGIILRDQAILLVRYRDPGGDSYLVCPGGASLDDEGICEAVVRETREETGVIVRPVKPLIIEDLTCREFKMCKIWLLCEHVSGEVARTEAHGPRASWKPGGFGGNSSATRSCSRCRSWSMIGYHSRGMTGGCFACRCGRWTSERPAGRWAPMSPSPCASWGNGWTSPTAVRARAPQPAPVG